MTVHVVETDEAGRSALVEKYEPEPIANEGASIQNFWTSLAIPPQVRPPAPSDDVELITVTPAPLGATWMNIEFPPGWEIGLHRTETLDCDFIVAGSITVILETGEVELATGDALRIAGAAHGWRAGDAGCTMLVMTLGATTDG